MRVIGSKFLEKIDGLINHKQMRNPFELLQLESSEYKVLILFVLSYILFCFLLQFILEHSIEWKFSNFDTKNLSFEINTIIQFILWIPFGLGIWVVDFKYYPLTCFAHEIFDLLLFFVINSNHYRFSNKKFLIGHHLISTISHLILGLLILTLSPMMAIPDFFRMIFLYYICSLFLVFPSILETVLINGSIKLVRTFKIILFFGARISHISIFCYGIFTVWTLEGELNLKIMGSVIGTILLFANEYHSIKNGYRKLLNEK